MSFKTNSLMIWGHRGHRHHRYDGYKQPPHENSINAYQQVLKLTTGMECDVVQSSQNTPFLIHDTLFTGITRYELQTQLDTESHAIVKGRYLYQLDNEEIGQLKLKDGQSIPRLSHLLELFKDYPDRMVQLELKGPNVAKATLQSVERAIQKKWITPRQIIFASYNLPALHNLRMNVGRRFQITVMLTPSDLNLAQMYPNWPNAEQNAYYIPFSAESLKRPDVREIEPDFLHIEAHCLTKNNLETVYNDYPDSRIILWCAGEKHPDIDAFFIDKIASFANKSQLFAVISDYPDAVQKKLSAMGLDIQKPDNPYTL